MTTIFGGVWAFVIPKLKKGSIPRRMKYIISAEKNISRVRDTVHKTHIAKSDKTKVKKH